MKKPKKQGPTAEEKALQEVSIGQWNDYVARFRPAEAELARRAEFTRGEKLAAEGMAGADAAAAFKGLTRDTIASQKIAGADASSGRTKFALAGNAEAKGKATGLAAAAASTGQKIQSDAERLGITAIGRGVASGTTSDMAAGARRATNLALAAREARFERNQSIVLGAATVAGAATARYQLNKNKSLEEIDMNSLPSRRGIAGVPDDMLKNPDSIYDYPTFGVPV